MRAAELLGKEIGMFVERQELGRPGEFDRLIKMTDEELDAYEAEPVRRVQEDREKRGRLLSEQD